MAKTKKIPKPSWIGSGGKPAGAKPVESVFGRGGGRAVAAEVQKAIAPEYMRGAGEEVAPAAVDLSAQIAFQRSLEYPGIMRTAENAAAGATTVLLNERTEAIPANGGWMLFGAYSTNAEIRKISSIASGRVTLDSALSNAHGVNDVVLFLDSPVVNVKWFGAKGDNSTDDTTAINAALAVDLVAPASVGIVTTSLVKGVKVVMPPGEYLMAGPMNGCNRSDVTLVGAGGSTTSTILHCTATDKAAIELIGAQNIHIEGIAIRGDATSVPKVGIWTGRSSTNLNASRIYFKDVYIFGSFGLSAWLNCGSESNHWDHCVTYPTAGHGIVFDYRNALSGITPDNATLDLTYDTAISRIFNSYLTCPATNTGFIPVYVYAGNAPTIRDNYLVSYGAPIVYGRGGISSGLLDYVSVEGTPTYVLHVTVDATYNTAANTTRFGLRNTGGTGSSGYSVYFADNAVYADSTIEECSFSTGLRFYDINSCRVLNWALFSNSVNPALTVAGAGGNCEFSVDYNDDLTVTGTLVNTLVHYRKAVSGGGGSMVLYGNYWLRMGSLTSAAIKSVLTTTTTWDPASLDDGASATTYYALTGVDADGTWIAWASLSTMIAQGWMITAHPYGGGVVVTIMNRTGGTVDLGSGTLRVVAMKVG